MLMTGFLLTLALTAQADAVQPGRTADQPHDAATIEAVTGVTPANQENVTEMSEPAPVPEKKTDYDALPQATGAPTQPAAQDPQARTPEPPPAETPATVETADSTQAGGLHAGFFPSARTLSQDEAYIDVENLLLWRLAWGVTDRLTAEVRSAWGFSLGIGLKYALVQSPGHSLSVGAWAQAGVFSRSDNTQQVSMLYTRDFDEGAIHVGAHGIRLQSRRMLTGLTDNEPAIMLIPQLGIGGEAQLHRHLLGLLNISYGENLRTPTPIENTGIVDLGFRIGSDRAFADLLLLVPLTPEWLEQDVLGIPFLRVGMTL